jgi:glycosyltransferase involved in cell wall biosynthesis
VECLAESEVHPDRMSPFNNSSQTTVIMTGARMHYAVPRLLYEAGLLKRFYTDAYIGNKPVLEWLLRHVPGMSRIPAIARWLGRKDPIIPGQLVSSFDSFTFRQTLRLQREMDPDRTLRVLAEGNKTFNEWVVSQGIEGCRTLYGYNRNSLEVFQYAKPRGISCLLEQCSAPRRIEIGHLTRELELWPDWEPGLETPSPKDPLIDREEEEWSLADRIVVPSKSVETGMRECGYDHDNVKVIPYGIDLRSFVASNRRTASRDQKLRLLYVGRVSLMKGVTYLLEALRMINSVNLEARIVGSVLFHKSKTDAYNNWAKFEGSVPRSRIRDVINWADLAIMPSLSEGSSTFVLEAMALGLPVIATESSGSLIRNGIDGFIVADRNPQALADSITRVLEERDLLNEFSDRLKESWPMISLEAYQRRLTQEILEPQ